MQRRELDQRFANLAQRRPTPTYQPPQEYQYEPQYEEEYYEEDPRNLQGSGKFSKALSGAHQFIKKSGLVSKGLTYAGHPEFAAAARSFGYGMDRYQGSGLVGGVAPVVRKGSSGYNAVYGAPDKRALRAGQVAWLNFRAANYPRLLRVALEELNNQSGANDMVLFGHSPPNGKDLNRYATYLTGEEYRRATGKESKDFKTYAELQEARGKKKAAQYYTLNY
jgi:hypothetical protein